MKPAEARAVLKFLTEHLEQLINLPPSEHYRLPFDVRLPLQDAIGSLGSAVAAAASYASTLEGGDRG